MVRLLVLWGRFGALIGVALAIVTLKGGVFDWAPILVLGAIGAGIGAIGAVVVRISTPAHPSHTNYLAILGSLVGASAGGPLGVITGLGQPMLALFNPELPRRGFLPLFGAIGGVFIGAVAGALAGAALSRTLGCKAEPSDGAESR